MRSSSRLTVCRSALGTTEASELWAEAPQLLRITGRSTPDGPLTVHLVGGAAGPLGGDDSEFVLNVGRGAQLCVRSVAATLAQPGAHPGAPASRATVRVRVAAGAVLDWQPEPIIAVEGCKHSLHTVLEVDEGASVVWGETIVCGRFGEATGSLWSRQRITVSGSPVLDHEVRVGEQCTGPGWHGTARHISSLVRVGPPSADAHALHGTTGNGAAIAAGVRTASFEPAPGVRMELVLRD